MEESTQEFTKDFHNTHDNKITQTKLNLIMDKHNNIFRTAELSHLNNLNNFNDLEGIINDEPSGNKYETVQYHKLNIFPYFLVGKIISKFEVNEKTIFLNGVGILIGPEIVLTVAHILLYVTEKNEFIEPTRVYFFPAANADFCPFENVKSIKVVVNKGYYEGLKTNDKLTQLSNDWGLVYLNSSVGTQITSLFGVDEEYASDLKLSEDRLYHYFCYNENQEINSDILISQKLSIIGYTEFKSEYSDNPLYRFRYNFLSNNDLLKDGPGSTEKKLGMTNINGMSMSMQKSNFIDKKTEKKINVSIKLKNSSNSLSTDLTEGLATNTKYQTPDRIRKVKSLCDRTQVANGSDFIVFGHEKFNKDFDKTDSDKLIMSESKGNLIENEKKCIKYIISTYKGQSGSPIFLRIKNKTSSVNMRYSLYSNRSDSIKKHFYSYHFIGLHSRRGTLEDKYVNKDLEHNLENKYNPDDINFSFSKIHKFSDYNSALSVIGRSTKSIIEEIKSCNSVMVKQNKNFMTTASDFISVRIILNEEEKLFGLFKRSSSLSLIFELGAAILNLNKEFVLLKEITNQNISDIVQNYNYDQDKQISDLLEFEENNILVFDLRLNIKKYGEFLAIRLYDKFLETYGIEKDDFKQLFDTKYSKKFFQLVFAEIAMFENSYPVYGLLFNKIKHTVMSITESKDT